MPLRFLQWDIDAWADYLYWQKTIRKILNASTNSLQTSNDILLMVSESPNH